MAGDGMDAPYRNVPSRTGYPIREIGKGGIFGYPTSSSALTRHG
ncbi:hypothetical protein A7A08_01772 [Methyloligella halotolerans]|uniref:Uncharacterized protein n=1 Tax=Methyloligella halotolerans TaxID=1177755 RepID=A0A1E2RZS0_9HYPH|nr:hypothetical protein A7A08_01772 [Methyloligella halotolerans]